jgi:nucleotide-binding universal stress UspA family protein
MFKNIAVAYDSSSQSCNALKMASDLAREQIPAAILWLVSVMDASPWEMGEPYLSHFIEQRTSIGQSLLSEARASIAEEIEIHTELLFGTPAECIIQVAETRGCDLIVMGTRGLGLLQGLLLGSQAQKVVSHAHCPVLLVK